MLQLRQNPILNRTKHRLIAHSTRNYGYEASFARFYQISYSQRNHHASAQIEGQLVLFDQLCSNKAVAGATIN